MQALRLIATPINHQLVIDLPPGLDDRQLEVIVLPAGEQRDSAGTGPRRKPNPRLKGTVSVGDDLIEPAATERDWDVLS
jgi:hypothetical protein